MGTMALIITVAGLKGGVGKSTIAVNIAATVHHSGQRVLLVDMDRQGTTSRWAAHGAELGVDGPPVIGVLAKTLSRDVDALVRGYDLVVVDTPPRLEEEARVAMALAHMVLVPVAPGAADMWALEETLDVVRKAQAIREDLVARIVLNRVSRTVLARQTAKSLWTAPMLQATLGDRVAFGDAMLAGDCVVHHAPRSVAAAEVEELVREILEEVG